MKRERDRHEQREIHVKREPDEKKRDREMMKREREMEKKEKAEKVKMDTM